MGICYTRWVNFLSFRDLFMTISWLGEAGLKIQTKDVTVLIDPPAASTGFKPTKQAATIVCLTQPDHRDAKSIAGDPLVINSPGEFERQNVFVYGLQLPSDGSRVHFRVEAEDMSLAHLADIAKKPENGELAQLEGVDILCVPVGGKSVLSAEDAAELISQIEPRIVIPIQYKVPGSTMGYSDASAWLKEMGAKSLETSPKFKILKKDLPAEETQVVLLARE